MNFSCFRFPGPFKRLAFILPLVLTLSAALAPATTTNTLAYSQAWSQDQSHPALKGFSQWVARFGAATTPTAKAQLISEGVSLAQQRRTVLAKLIKTDPQKAISFSVPASVRQQLPPEIADQLEKRISAIGDFSVMLALQAKGGSPVEPISRFV